MLFFFTATSMTLLISLIMALSNKFYFNKNKMSPFECGFDPYLAPRNPFSIQFFKILLIFILFDMEIVIILPAPLFMIFSIKSMTALLTMLIILMLGLLFEWKEGSLSWLKSSTSHYYF